jgi:ATP-dependent exoDNAse (exonuclease V) alpha subunit
VELGGENRKAEELSTGREIEIALPAELSIEQNISLARRFVDEQFVRAGMCADLCVHDKGDGNPHAHILLTMRPLNLDGSWGAKVIKVNGKKTYPVDWDNRDNAELWRKAWAAYCNTVLRINGHDSVVDHRSYERQGVEQIPTIHLGPTASSLENRDIRTELGDRNREIAAMNSKLRQINARLKKLEAYKFELLQSPPTLYEVFSELYKTPPEKRSQKWHITYIRHFGNKTKGINSKIEQVSFGWRTNAETEGAQIGKKPS